MSEHADHIALALGLFIASFVVVFVRFRFAWLRQLPLVVLSAFVVAGTVCHDLEERLHVASHHVHLCCLVPQTALPVEGIELVETHVAVAAPDELSSVVGSLDVARLLRIRSPPIFAVL